MSDMNISLNGVQAFSYVKMMDAENFRMGKVGKALSCITALLKGSFGGFKVSVTDAKKFLSENAGEKSSVKSILERKISNMDHNNIEPSIHEFSSNYMTPDPSEVDMDDYYDKNAHMLALQSRLSEFKDAKAAFHDSVDQLTKAVDTHGHLSRCKNEVEHCQNALKKLEDTTEYVNDLLTFIPEGLNFLGYMDSIDPNFKFQNITMDVDSIEENRNDFLMYDIKAAKETAANILRDF